MNIPKVKALVPMRHHSARVPGKNLRPLCGRPLFHWIMESLSNSPYIDEIIINTDSEQIAEDATRNFDVTIVWRPDHLLGEMVGIQPLIEYDIANSEGEYYLQTHSTNPLLKTETINHAIETFFSQTEHDSLFTVTPLHTRFYWPDGRPVNHDPDNLIRTQDLPPIYEENSCIYLFSRAMFDQRKHRLGQRPLMFPIDRFEAVDIDEEFDFTIADILMARRLETQGEGDHEKP